MHSTGTRGYITTTIRAIPRAIPLNVQYHYIKICYGIMWLSRRQLSYQNKATSHSPQNLLRKLVRLLWLPICQGNNGISLFSCFCSLLVIFCHCIKDTCKKADPNSWNGSKSNWISKEDHPWCCDRKFIQCSNHTAIRNIMACLKDHRLPVRCAACHSHTPCRRIWDPYCGSTWECNDKQ